MTLRKLALGLIGSSVFAIATPSVPAGSSADATPVAAPAAPVDTTVIATAAADPFPTPVAAREGVAFWKRVWSEWTLAQVALHDNVYHQVVYEVIDLPGSVGEVYTGEQRDFVKERREALQARLEVLESKLAESEPLDDGEKELALLITSRAGADAIQGARERVRAQRGLRERFLRGVEISGRYLPEFKSIFREAGLPEDLAYLPHVESSFQEHARSSAGAVGMWQFTRPAAKRFLTMTPSVDERLDPVASARGAARYMKQAFDELGTWPLAVTSYNHGIGGMRRAKERFGEEFDVIISSFDGKTFGFASRNFYVSFVAARDVAKAYETSPPPDLTFEVPLALDHVVLDAPATAAALAHRYRVKASELAILNRAWTRRAVRGGASIPAGVRVWLPAGTLDRIASGPSRRQVAGRTEIGARARVHTVARGDTLSRIAQQYGVPLRGLLAHNGLRVDSVVRPGQKIRIPPAH